MIINAFHFAEMIENYLQKHNNFDLHIEISREQTLLDTGGGLKEAAQFFLKARPEEPFILHNVDVISNIDFARMVKFHGEKMLSPHSRFKSARPPAILCSMTRSNCAAGAQGGMANCNWSRPAPSACAGILRHPRHFAPVSRNDD